MTAEANIDRGDRAVLMSVPEAKARLREWGAAADEAQRLMLEAARERARKATPYAALAAGVLGVLSAGGLLRRGKRARERGEGDRAGPVEGLVPLILAGMRLAPAVLGIVERVTSRGRGRGGRSGEDD